MKVILLKDVAKIGRRFEVCEVPDGYAMNLLIPKGMAETASKENIKKVQARAAKLGDEAAAGSEALQAAITASKAEAIELLVEANEQDHLFEAVKAEAIVAAAAARELVVAADQITMAEPIKTVGEHVVKVAAADTAGEIKISVVKK